MSEVGPNQVEMAAASKRRAAWDKLGFFGSSLSEAPVRRLGVATLLRAGQEEDASERQKGRTSSAD